MTDQAGKITFLPWYRIGIGNDLTPSHDNAEHTHARFSVAVDFTRPEAGAEQRKATAELALYGPGEILNIDTKVVLRTYPENNAPNIETNYFPYLEFDQVDFPWRYTPERPSSADTDQSDRLPPWLCLIALDDEEIDAFEITDLRDRLPVLSVQNEFLPDLDHSWAWAHVQISALGDEEPIDESTISDIIEQEPERVISRLMCPRYLKPNRHYTVFLVPVYERGMRAGLHLPLEPEGEHRIRAINNSWTKNPEAPDLVELPVYYHWRFKTAEAAGDFESLVKKLLDPPPQPLPASIGLQDLDLSDPGLGLPATIPDRLKIEGALVAPASRNVHEGRWNAIAQEHFVEELKEILNTALVEIRINGDPIKVLAPPLYGRWHAARKAMVHPVPAGSGTKPWLHQLNSAPMLRATAGLGTSIIQLQQQQLMDEAWGQVEGIQGLNRFLREAQAACMISTRLYERDFQALPVDQLEEITQPIFKKITNSPTTISGIMARSRIPEAVLEIPFKKLARKMGPIGKRIRRMGRDPSSGFLEKLNQGGYHAPAAKYAINIPTWSELISNLRPSQQIPKSYRNWFIGSMGGAGLGAFGLSFGQVFQLGGIQALGSFALGISALLMAFQFRRYQRLQAYRDGLQKGTLNADLIKKAPVSSQITIQERPWLEPEREERGIFSNLRRAQANRRSGVRFRNAVSRFFEDGNLIPGPIRTNGTPGLIDIIDIQQPEPLDQSSTRDTILARIKPEVNLRDLVKDRVQLAPWLKPNPDERFCDPILAAPEFNRPMYELVRDYYLDWLLPGVEQIEENTISLLLANKTFVESFMVGLNHEMSRELLWREFPTDQRGTYFRQFWDVSGYLNTDPNMAEITDVQAEEWLTNIGVVINNLSSADRDLAIQYAKDQIFKETIRDIQPIVDWENELGEHHRADMDPIHATCAVNNTENLVLLIRGELLQRYPNAIIYAQQAQRGADDIREKVPGAAHQKYPIFKGSIGPDICFFGFRLLACQTRGDANTGDEGYYFVIEENPSGSRFGLDAPGQEKDYPTDWENLSWSDLFPDTAILENTAPYLNPNDLPSPHSTTSAHFAYITFQPPFRVLIHGSDMLPPTTSVWTIVQESPNHQRLTTALLAAQLPNDLLGSGPFTIFAPTDVAFDALPADQLEEWLSKPDTALANLLRHHIVPGNLHSEDLQDGQRLSSQSGESLNVQIQAGGMLIDNGTIISADLLTDNGTVHFIDTVLIPSNMP